MSVRKMARAADQQLSDDRAEKLGMVTHYAVGAGGGPLVVALIGSGMAPVKAGVAVGAAMEIVADQGINTVPGLTPPPALPLITHVRAVALHVVHGLAFGLMLEAGSR